MYTRHTKPVMRIADPKRKYIPYDECARKTGVISATMKLQIQFALWAKLDAAALVCGGWISLAYSLNPTLHVTE